MRIALISPLFESVPPKCYGGTERVIYNLCRGLEDSDAEVTVFASGDSKLPYGTLVPIVDQALRLSNPPPKDPLPYHFKLLSEIAREADQFDLIHNHNDYWMLPLSEMTRTPVLTSWHGRLDLPDLPAAARAFPKNSFVSISNSQRRALPDLNWARTVYNGIDLDRLEFHPKPGQYLAFLGRIDADKRPDYAIEIAKKSGVPLKIAAKIEGDLGWEYYHTRVKPHVDGKFIEFVGEISDGEKSEFLGNALGLVFPIDWPEPFGLVLVEALACGTPVLARPCGAVPELMNEGVTGFCHLEIDELAKRVPHLHKLDRQACRDWVAKHFSLQRMTEEYLDVYRELIEADESASIAGRIRPLARRRRDLLYPVERAAY